MRTFVIAEIGINHNGDIAIAKKLIETAAASGCDAVKFQKRTVDKVYSKEVLDSPRQSPWGTTQRDQKKGLELGEDAYDEINAYCRQLGIPWFASAWDMDSQLFLRKYDCAYNKVASAMLTNMELVEEIAREKRYTFISTGMSSWEEIDEAVAVFRTYRCPFELMHCNSAYPMPIGDANLQLMAVLAKRYGCKVGYSGHEEGLLVSICAAAAGASTIERHITLDKTMYGSDQKASLEPDEIKRLVKNIRDIEKIMGTGEKTVTDAELAARKKLRGN